MQARQSCHPVFAGDFMMESISVKDIAFIKAESDMSRPEDNVSALVWRILFNTLMGGMLKEGKLLGMLKPAACRQS
jgi:hypothetical protein